jgi:sugar lactone lactonase YvrE
MKAYDSKQQFRRQLFILLLCILAPLCASGHPGDGLGVDSKGNIYFTDVNTRTLWRVDADGELRAIVTNRWAHGLCIDDLDRVWLEVEVSNTLFSVSRIETDGTETHILGPLERGLDFYGVNLLADANGNLYFPHSDPPQFFASGIRRRSPDGRVKLLAGSGEYGWRDGQGTEARFAGINAMRFGPDGRIYVVDGDAIRRVSLDGQVTTLSRDIKVEKPEDQPFDNGNPSVSNRLYGLDVGRDETVYVAYHGNRRVLKLRGSKAEVVYRSTRPWSPVGVALWGENTVIKESGLEPGSSQTGPRIRLVKPDGTITTIATVGK